MPTESLSDQLTTLFGGLAQHTTFYTESRDQTEPSSDRSAPSARLVSVHTGPLALDFFPALKHLLRKKGLVVTAETLSTTTLEHCRDYVRWLEAKTRLPSTPAHVYLSGLSDVFVVITVPLLDNSDKIHEVNEMM